MPEILLKVLLAVAFAGVCAYAYLRLAKKRRNVRRESLLIFASLFLFSFVRLMTT